MTRPYLHGDDGGTVPGDRGTSPSDRGTSPGDGGTSPSDSGSSPGDSGSSSGDSGTSAGDSGTSPSDRGSSPGELVRRLLTPRFRRVDLAVAALLCVLGFSAVVQVRSTQEDGPLAAARQEDLVQILDELTNRNERLREEISSLEQARREITTGTDRSEAALAEARRRAQLLGVLAGTVPAGGPGLRLTITDPRGSIGPEVLLNALEELRAAGAEAVQLEGAAAGGASSATGPAVRVVASTSFLEGEDGGVLVDGTLLRQPYRFVVVGDGATLSTALTIPGGVVDDVEQRGGRAVIERSEDVRVTAVRPLPEPRYARPAA